MKIREAAEQHFWMFALHVLILILACVCIQYPISHTSQRYQVVGEFIERSSVQAGADRTDAERRSAVGGWFGSRGSSSRTAGGEFVPDRPGVDGWIPQWNIRDIMSILLVTLHISRTA